MCAFVALLARHANAPREQRLSHVVRVRQIQHRITQQHQQLFVFSSEQSSERLLPGFHHHALSHPLPKLRLCRPKLLPVTANHQRRLLFAFLLFVRVNVCAHR